MVSRSVFSLHQNRHAVRRLAQFDDDIGDYDEAEWADEEHGAIDDDSIAGSESVTNDAMKVNSEVQRTAIIADLHGRVSHESMSMHFATLSSKGELIHEVCSKSHARTLATKFLQLIQDVPFWSACGESKWMEEMHRLSPTGPKIMLDIGCNKGYTSAKMFGMWAPEIGFNPRALHKNRPEVWCGNCGDCQEDIKSEISSSSGGLTVYCFEPSQANFANLLLTRDTFFQSTKSDVHWLTMNVAASNQTGSAHFARNCTSEQCALNLESNSYDLIDTITVDAFIEKYQIPYVDILKIDAEGFDATVIQGSLQSIAGKKIGVVSFEYHEVGVWRHYALKEVVEWFNGFDYVCYFDGKPSLARLTGCWDDAYEMYEWSNVVCLKRTDPLYPVLERMTLRHETYPDSYFKTS